MYVNHPTDRPNFCQVSVDGVSFWFSYRTCIAFETNLETVVSVNHWGPTTGKHINYVSTDASKRLPREEFERRLNEVTVLVSTDPTLEQVQDSIKGLKKVERSLKRKQVVNA